MWSNAVGLFLLLGGLLAAEEQQPLIRPRNQTPSRQYVPKKFHPCEKSSCYPATGNLLIGRENNLFASSTCGLRGQERYCIVSHLEDRKKCFWCETRRETENQPALNHRIANVVSRYQPGTRHKSWWQSQNGVENVYIQLNLEAEFHFTHLIIVFKTFRPAAMLVERSFDFGKTWHVYRYFAHSCDESFPGKPKHAPRTFTDVVCESKYSSVAPSFDGEVIFKVLPPNLHIDNPYSQDIQNLLKITNLRINFTKLHTLGDDLLDNRAEIQEKYYYAISDIIVRGSCSCYGHASRCLPLPGVESKTDMVHGRCECTHNTKGLNCELCEDFFNDLEWKPAVGKVTNACKKCNCNNHATSCHFDAAVYEASGNVSGGVCDDCQHNTFGRNCDLCKDYFYQDPQLPIQDPYICKPCDCDPRGSIDDAICDSVTDLAMNKEAGRCHCKLNVEGRRCDNCKNGFWNFSESNPEGCQACTCNLLGTIDNHGCDVFNGVCTCKRFVTGRDCDQCAEFYYGLSESEEGCSPCDCDIGGALNNNCNMTTGQCECRNNVQGRRCDQPAQNYFSPSLDALIYEAERSECNSEMDENIIHNNCQVIAREPFRDGRVDTFTGIGFKKVFEDDVLEFVIDDIVTSMDYDIVIRYEPQMPGNWEDVIVTLNRPEPVDLDSVCGNYKPIDDIKSVVLPDNSRQVVLDTPVCLEAGKKYNLKVNFVSQKSGVPNNRASVLIDSIVLIPKVLSLPFFSENNPVAESNRLDYLSARCDDPYYLTINKENLPEACKKLFTSIGYYIFEGGRDCQCDPTGSTSYNCEDYGGACQCKVNIVGRRCDRCASGTYGFGPNGCKACDCNNIGSLDNFCDIKTGQCKCRPNTYGRQCDECQPGYWNFPNCQQCDCEGHADICESKTGACIGCRDYTVGHNCNRCLEGFYGDPRIGVDIACRPCPCPGTIQSLHSFAPTCELDDYTKDVVCQCNEGYAGSRCDSCDHNYYGHPEVPGGSCQPCECNNNIDMLTTGNCDPHTGNCLKCLFDTEGDHCEHCIANYYGDALMKTCEPCICNILGTDASQGPCNGTTGQCPCHKNVIGQSCDQCIENHWKIASGQGCEPCECDPVGSLSEQCNEFTGQCQCKQGFGGRQCDQCEANYWGDPNKECFPCQCDQEGSASQQCKRDTGDCICHVGIGGRRCNECARGFFEEQEVCLPCGECFDNWDRIISGLLDETNYAINNASKIKTVGATGAYTGSFDDMDEKLKNIQVLVNTTLVGESEIESFENNVEKLKESLQSADEKVSQANADLANHTSIINKAKIALEDLHNRNIMLTEKSKELNENATILQEANLEGALNLTRDAKQRSVAAGDDADKAQIIIRDTERQIKGTELLLERQYGSFNTSQKENDNNLKGILDNLGDLESQIPELNQKLCGQKQASGNACDDICGGAGCGKCGGISCDRGALTKADQALDFANMTESRIKEIELKADDLLREISSAKTETAEARTVAKNTFDAALEARNTADSYIKQSSDVTQDLNEFLTKSGATPSDVRALANEILDMSIELKPEQISDLAREINETVSHLTDIERIIEDTRADLENAKNLKDSASKEREMAMKTLEITKEVIAALDEAEEAQKLADEAINKANEDIEATKGDFIPIATETILAQEQANETMESASILLQRLNDVQKKILMYDNDAKQVKAEASDVVMIAESAQGDARDLRQKYDKINNSLAHRANQSISSTQRAQMLLQKATQLASDTQKQLKELQEMEVLYNSHTDTIASLEKQIDEMTEKVTFYLDKISEQSEYHRSCTT